MRVFQQHVRLRTWARVEQRASVCWDSAPRRALIISCSRDILKLSSIKLRGGLNRSDWMTLPWAGRSWKRRIPAVLKFELWTMLGTF